MKTILLFLFCLTASVGFVSRTKAAVAGETAHNLRSAFVGESNAAHRYQRFAEKADAEGFGQVAKLFRAAAKSEEIHRERHRSALAKIGGDTTEVVLDQVQVGTTAANLRAAIEGESYERDTMYPKFITTAKAEDARPALRTLQAALSAEKEHAKLFQEALDQLGHNPDQSYFVCRACGFTVTIRPSDRCSVCREPASKFLTIL